MDLTHVLQTIGVSSGAFNSWVAIALKLVALLSFLGITLKMPWSDLGDALGVALAHYIHTPAEKAQIKTWVIWAEQRITGFKKGDERYKQVFDLAKKELPWLPDETIDHYIEEAKSTLPKVLTGFLKGLDGPTWTVPSVNVTPEILNTPAVIAPPVPLPTSEPLITPVQG